MAINLNEDEQQKEGTGRTIPPKSKVWVRLEVNYPDQIHAFSGDTTLWQSGKSSLGFLGTTLTVTRGQFEGKKIYHNFNVAGGSTQGHREAINISRRYIRALVEAAYGISPNDASPEASQKRMIDKWTDIDGAQFAIVIGCEKSKPSAKTGMIYTNNIMTHVVTVDDPDYQTLCQDGEIISNEPIPDFNNDNQPASAKSDGGWGSGQSSYAATTAQQKPWGQQSAAAAPKEQPQTENPNKLAPTEKVSSAEPPWARGGSQINKMPPPPQNQGSGK